MVRMRMVATDLDGTVVRRDGTISQRTLKALQACEDAGVDVVFVTGRPPRWMTGIIEQTGHRGLALCGNGAAVLDLADGSVVQSDALDAAAVTDVADRLRAHLPGAAFALETLTGLRCEPTFELRHTVELDHPRVPLAQLLSDRPAVLKILCRQGGEHARTIRVDEMLALARTALAGVAEPVHSDPLNHMLEISAPGVTKGTALARLAASRGIDPQDVVAFGDMPNDAPMLSWAGVGYAMTGGHPEAVQAADEVAPPCDEDGVAQVLEALLAAADAG
jgi:HAD superfamily hydrolase (TIGR01484 family)